MTNANAFMKVIIVSKGSTEEAGVQTLRAHGCHIEKHKDGWEITFPEGTSREALDIPAVIRSRFTLPDGLIVQETYLSEQKQSILDYHEQANTKFTGQSARQIQRGIRLQQNRVNALVDELVMKAEIQEFTEELLEALEYHLKELVAWNTCLTAGQVMNQSQLAERDILVRNIEKVLDDNVKGKGNDLCS